jgi:hypothetical protein
MVQIVQMQRAPSLGEALGAGLGQGMSQGLNMAVQTMYESRANRNRNSQLLKALGREDMIDQVGDLPTDYVMAAMKLKEEQGAAKQLSNLSSLLSPDASTEGNVTTPAPAARTLSPQQAPMLNDQSLGRTTEGVPPYTQAQQPPYAAHQARQSVPGQEISRLTARQKLDNLEKNWGMVQQQLKLKSDEPGAAAAFKQAKDIYDKNRAKLVQEGNLEQRERSADIQQKTFESGQEEKLYKRHKEVFDLNRKQIEDVVNPIADRESKNSRLKPQLAAARQAVESGQTEGYWQFLSGNGILPGLTPESGVLNYLGKEGVGSLVDRMGGRANQFIEKLAKGAQASPGMKKETARAIIDFQEAEIRHDEKEAELADKLAEKYSKSSKPMNPGKFRRELDKEMKPWVEKNVSYTAYKAQESAEKDLSDEALFDQAFYKASVPGWTPITQRRMKAIVDRVGGDPEKAVEKAKRLGYKFEPQMTPPE